MMTEYLDVIFCFLADKQALAPWVALIQPIRFELAVLESICHLWYDDPWRLSLRPPRPIQTPELTAVRLLRWTSESLGWIPDAELERLCVQSSSCGSLRAGQFRQIHSAKPPVCTKHGVTSGLWESGLMEIFNLCLKCLPVKQMACRREKDPTAGGFGVISRRVFGVCVFERRPAGVEIMIKAAEPRFKGTFGIHARFLLSVRLMLCGCGICSREEKTVRRVRDVLWDVLNVICWWVGL